MSSGWVFCQVKQKGFGDFSVQLKTCRPGNTWNKPKARKRDINGKLDSCRSHLSFPPKEKAGEHTGISTCPSSQLNQNPVFCSLLEFFPISQQQDNEMYFSPHGYYATECSVHSTLSLFTILPLGQSYPISMSGEEKRVLHLYPQRQLLSTVNSYRNIEMLQRLEYQN